MCFTLMVQRPHHRILVVCFLCTSCQGLLVDTFSLAIETSNLPVPLEASVAGHPGGHANESLHIWQRHVRYLVNHDARSHATMSHNCGLWTVVHSLRILEAMQSSVTIAAAICTVCDIVVAFHACVPDTAKPGSTMRNCSILAAVNWLEAHTVLPHRQILTRKNLHACAPTARPW